MNKLGISRLVDYSSDEEQSDTEITDDSSRTFKKNTTRQFNKGETSISNPIKCEALPLPSEIQSMFADYSKDVIDDSEKHGGKMRSFPHERGVWATYVYIEYNPEPEFLEMIEHLRNVSEKHGIILSCTEDFHVSLSRTVKLRHHWIQLFVDSLRAHLRCFIKFKIMFQSLEVYENEEKTRTFLGLKVHIGCDYLCKITEKVDACLAEFKLPSFYETPSFHLSCASCVGSKAEQIELFMADLNDIFQSFSESHPACRTLWITDIYCKTGNKFFKFPLKSLS